MVTQAYGYAAPQVVTYGAASQQFVYAAPPMQQVVYLNAPEGQAVQVDEAGQVVQADGTVMEAQPLTYFAAPEGQQVLSVDEQGNPLQVAEGAEGAVMMSADGQVLQQQVLYAPPPPAPARINVSPEIFAKLAAGGTLTPEEIAEISGPTPAMEAGVEVPTAVPGADSPAGAPAAGVASSSAKASKKKSSKKALKASKKKKTGCC